MATFSSGCVANYSLFKCSCHFLTVQPIALCSLNMYFRLQYRGVELDCFPSNLAYVSWHQGTSPIPSVTRVLYTVPIKYAFFCFALTLHLSQYVLIPFKVHYWWILLYASVHRRIWCTSILLYTKRWAWPCSLTGNVFFSDTDLLSVPCCQRPTVMTTY